MCLLAWYVFLSLHNGRFEGSMVSLWANTEQCVCVCVCVCVFIYGFPSSSAVKNPPAVQEPWIRKIPWRRAWLPTSVFLPRESYG